MGVKLTDSIREALERNTYWHLATLNPDGSPQSTAIWIDTRGDKILVNTALGRKKPRNIEHDPRVALSYHEHDKDGVYHSWGVQGRVVETIVGDEAEADIDRLAVKYLGVTPYPFRSEGERRVTYVIEPLHVFEMGG
jgi:PPOX class probable F420-dependent enzyme